MAKILILADNMIVSDTLKVLLKRGGHQVFCARYGKEGLRLLLEKSPRLVVIDSGSRIDYSSPVLGTIRTERPDTLVAVLSDSDQSQAKYGAVPLLPKGKGLFWTLAMIEQLLAGTAGRGAPLKSTPVRVLIADDDEQVLSLLSDWASLTGWEVIQAADGLIAEKLALQHRPDIAIIDIFMPGKNGVELVETLHARLPETGIIVISGYGKEETARECLKKGAFDYITKPPNLELMERAISAHLLLHGERRRG